MPFKDPEKKKQYSRKYNKIWLITNNDRFKERLHRHRDSRKEWLLTQKQGKSCIECKESDPHRLDFHHVDPSTKLGCVSDIARSSKQRALEEIKKCVLLCKSCHKKKNVGRLKKWGIRDNKRYPLARCIYLAHHARRGVRLQ